MIHLYVFDGAGIFCPTQFLWEKARTIIPNMVCIAVI